jgi:hypothetical protein
MPLPMPAAAPVMNAVFPVRVVMMPDIYGVSGQGLKRTRNASVNPA